MVINAADLKVPIVSMSQRENCPVCRDNAGNKRFFLEIDTAAGRHVLDKKKAGDMVLGRFDHSVDPEKLHELVAIRKDWVQEHVWHVDPTEPGIIGQLFGGIFLIDGFYRALHCIKQDIPFRAYILTFDETASCLVDGPAVTPLRAISEIREMLQRNLSDLAVDIPLRGKLTGENTPERMEELIRSALTDAENSRIRLVFHHEGKAIEMTPEKQKLRKPE